MTAFTRLQKRLEHAVAAIGDVSSAGLAAADRFLAARPQTGALLAGLVVPLAFAPFFLLPVFYAAYAAVFHLALKHALSADAHPLFLARLGFGFGFGQFFIGLLWMGEAFLVDAAQFLWALPFAVTLLPAGLALFSALAFLVFGLCLRQAAERGRPLRRGAAALLLALLLAAAAFARSTLLTGLPWNLPGMAWGSWLALAQPAALVGVHGLTLLVLLNMALLFQFHRRRWLAVAAAAIVPVLFAAAGAARLAVPAAPDTALQAVLVQPHLAQREKWQPQLREVHIDKTFRLTQQALKRHPDTDLIIWPETAIPALIDEGTGFVERLQAGLPAHDPLAQEKHPPPYLLTGAVRRDITVGGTHFYNSAMLWRGDGLLLARADKHHLVPFGEYLPAQRLLERIGLQQLTRLRGGYRAGPPEARLTAARLPLLAPLICYEAIFPPLAGGGERPALLVNLTNDGWFGRWHGPHQHLAQARLRAVEQGLPLLRAANTGISAAFDAHGRARGKIGLGDSGTLQVTVPAALPPTVYARFGDRGFAALWLAVFCGFLVLAGSRRA